MYLRRSLDIEHEGAVNLILSCNLVVEPTSTVRGDFRSHTIAQNVSLSGQFARNATIPARGQARLVLKRRMHNKNPFDLAKSWRPYLRSLFSHKLMPPFDPNQAFAQATPSCLEDVNRKYECQR